MCAKFEGTTLNSHWDMAWTKKRTLLARRHGQQQCPNSLKLIGLWGKKLLALQSICRHHPQYNTDFIQAFTCWWMLNCSTFPRQNCKGGRGQFCGYKLSLWWDRNDSYQIRFIFQFSRTLVLLGKLFVFRVLSLYNFNSSRDMALTNMRSF